ncbi:MAG: HupE/UreJ family protein [Verrucomicrobiota bacterium]
MKFARFFACLLLLTGFLHAHQVASVELELLKTESQWRLAGQMDIAYMLPETRNVPGGPPMSRAAAMKESPEELARFRRETENTLRKLLRFTFADKDVPWRLEFPDFEKDPFELPPEIGDIALLTTDLIIDPIPGAGELRVHWSGEQETELIILIEEGEDPTVISTLPGGSLMLIKQTGAGESLPVEKPLTGGWVQMGYHHVLPEGRDHMLFILGLFLLAPNWRSLLGQSLLFTLAHSITLALAVFKVVTIPESLFGIRGPVEVFIAISIAWIGIENLLVRKVGKQRLILVFTFGLLHGLGFASSIGQKMDGLSGPQLVGPLLGFNVGVELAQVTVLAAAFLVLWLLKKWTLQVQTFGSALVALAGIAWAIQRVFFPESPIF